MPREFFDPFKLMRARKDRGWTQKELASISGICASTLSKYERGFVADNPQAPSAKTVARLAEALDVDFAQLMSNEDELVESAIAYREWREHHKKGFSRVNVRKRWKKVLKKVREELDDDQ